MKLSQSCIDILFMSQGPLVLAVSGGPDSMCLAVLIRDFWLEQGRSLTDLHVAHYHHGVRVESDDERDFVMNCLRDMNVHVGYYQGGPITERNLRTARHIFFQSVMRETGSRVLLLGHNLTDRIETSLMNMKRGCHIRGLLNMREIEVKTSRGYHPLNGEDIIDEVGYVLRPLLNNSKQQIQDYCDEYGISYVIDQSNFDITVSVRNKIRSEIVMKLADQQLQNWRDLYVKLEISQPIYSNPVRDHSVGAWYVGQVGEWDLDYLAWLFDWSGCYADMTQGRLLEWQKRIGHSFSGHKFVGGWRRWIKQKKVRFAPISM